MGIEIKITTSADVYGVKIFSADSNAFAYAIKALKEIIPAVFRTYEPTEKIWKITNRAFLDDWIGDLRQRYEVETDYENDIPTSAPARTPTSPFQTLHLLPDAPIEVVKASYKALAKLHHPDARGDHEKMIEINRAFDELVKK